MAKLPSRAAPPSAPLMSSDDQELSEQLLENVIGILRSQLGVESTPVDALRSYCKRVSNSYFLHWKETKNPYWVWKCFARLSSISVSFGNLYPDYREHSFVGEFTSWCIDYLSEVSFRIEALAAGKDFRSNPLKDIKSEEAIGIIPNAFGFTSKGWNAFKEIKSEEIPMLFLQVRELEKMDGKKPSFDLEYLM